MKEEKEPLSVADWITLLSPASIALKSGSVMGLFTMTLSVFAEVPLFHIIVRTMIAVIIFTIIGWMAGYLFTSLDFDKLLGTQPEPLAFLQEEDDDVLDEAFFDEDKAMVEAFFEIPIVEETPVEPKRSSLTKQTSRLLSSTHEELEELPPLEPVASTTKSKKSRKMVV